MAHAHSLSKEDKEYLEAIVKKQLGLKDADAHKKASHISHAKAEKIIASAKCGDMATVRELLNE